MNPASTTLRNLSLPALVAALTLACTGASTGASGAGTTGTGASGTGASGTGASGTGASGTGASGTGADGTGAAPVSGPGVVVGHEAADGFEQVPQMWIDKARQDVRIFYGHLSHGDQLMNGLDMIQSNTGAPYTYDDAFIKEYYTSLDPRPDEDPWEPATRAELSAGSDRNVVMWAWSSWLGDPTHVDADHVANNYLAVMEQLELDFPNVRFVYFTGPAQTWKDPDGNMGARNKQIREYAITHGKMLFDFEDIELHDPDGNYYPDGTDACDWCSTWCSANDCAPASPPSCGACSEACTECDYNHTHCYNCYRKGRAFWYLAALLAGWEGN